uniref:Putative secreted peptide n=1 Tax=Anopheles braziliensis TaxID=58242 RepID=A0A2M3ZT37_9DIPT
MITTMLRTAAILSSLALHPNSSAARCNHDEPNSFIHCWYLARSSLDTLLLHLAMASLKSCFDTGRSSSSFASCRICSGFSPAILRRIDIIDASRHTFVISAPEYPSSRSAMSRMSTDSSTFTSRRLIFSNASRPSLFGSGM